MIALIFAALLVPAQALPLDRTQEAPLGPTRPYNPPVVQSSQLKSGVKLALIEMRRVPSLVSLQIIIPSGGAARDPQGKEGLAVLTAALMKEGAGAMTKREFRENLKDIAAPFSVGATDDALVLTVTATKANLDKALGLAAAAIRRQRAPQSEFDQQREEMISALTVSKGDAAALAGRRFDKRVYGNHPYGRSLDEASLKNLTLADSAAYAARLSPEGAVVAAAGDITLPELQTLTAKHFGDWRAVPGAAVAGQPVTPSAPGPVVIDVIDMPGSVQSVLRVGHTGIKNDDPDFFAFLMANYILGQANMVSRLNANLREKNGYAYGASSTLNIHKEGGDFVAGASVETQYTAAAISEIVKEIARMRDELVPVDELERDKLMYVTGAMMGRETTSAVVGVVSTIASSGLPKDRLAQSRAKINALTPAQIQAAAQKHFHPESLQIVVAGDAAAIRKELSALPDVLVREFDTDGKPKPVPAVSTPGAAK